MLCDWEKMPKRLEDENLEEQSQKKAKLTLQDVEANSIVQLISQPSQNSSRVSLIAIFVEIIFGATSLSPKIISIKITAEKIPAIAIFSDFVEVL